jgi:O-antigen/teichoic acid export membrane protein
LTSDSEALSTAPETPDVLDGSEAGGRLIRGGAMRSAGFVAGAALSLISAVLLTSHLGVVRFGEYTTVISLVTVVSAITDAGMSNVGTHEYVVRRGADRSALMRDLLGLRIFLSVVGLALAVCFALAAGYDTALLAGTLAAGLGTVAIVWQHTFSIPLAASLRLGVLSALEVARQAVSVAMIAGLVLLGTGVFPLLAVVLAANALLIPATAVFVRGEIPSRPSARMHAWLSLLRPTISFSLATAVGTIYIYTAQILTSLVASHHQSGLFAVSFRVFIVVAGVPGLLVSAALPVLSRAARDDRARLAYAVQRMFEVSLIIGLACAIGLAAGAQFVIGVVAPNEAYAGAVPVMRIQAFALLFTSVLTGWAFTLLSLERFRGMLIANAIAFTVSCVLTIVLASSSGAQGAATASLCGEFALASGYLIVLVRSHPEMRLKAQPAFLLKVLVAALPSVVLMLATNLPAVLMAGASLVIYGGLLLVTKALPPELADSLLHRWRAARTAGG